MVFYLLISPFPLFSSPSANNEGYTWYIVWYKAFSFLWYYLLHSVIQFIDFFLFLSRSYFFFVAVQVPITKGTHGTLCGTKSSVSSGTNYCIVLFNNILIFFLFFY